MAGQRDTGHLDIHDSASRVACAEGFGVTVGHLRKAARLVGNRTTVVEA